MAVVDDPLGHCEIGVAEGDFHPCIPWISKFAGGIRQQDHGLALEHFGDMPYRDAAHVRRATGGRRHHRIAVAFEVGE